jgi:hypothetical protein
MRGSSTGPPPPPRPTEGNRRDGRSERPTGGPTLISRGVRWDHHGKKRNGREKTLKRGDLLRPLSHHVLGCDDWTDWPHTVGQNGAVTQVELRERRRFEHAWRRRSGGHGHQRVGQLDGGDYPPSQSIAGLISCSNPSTIETKRHFLPRRKTVKIINENLDFWSFFKFTICHKPYQLTIIHLWDNKEPAKLNRDVALRLRAVWPVWPNSLFSNVVFS